MSKMSKLKVVTLNVRGIREKKKRNILINWFQKKEFDIICLQETFVTKEILPAVEKDFHVLGNYYSSCTNSIHSRGVGIIVSKNVNQWNVHSIHHDTDGRKILINVKNVINEMFSISCFYVPTNLNSRIRFINECNGWLLNHAANKNAMIIAGDFNTCYNASDRASGRLDKSGDALNDFIAKNNLIDVFRFINPETKGYTYIHKTEKTRHSRIDYILVSNTLVQTIQCSSVTSSPAPDHNALSVTLRFTTNKRGNGYWKLNNSLLCDENYKAIIRSDISHAIDTYGSIITKQELVDLIKVIVKESSIKYSTCKKARKLCKISQIEHELDLIDISISKSNNPTLLIKRESLKNELNNLYQEDSNAAYIRSRAKWLEQGEKSTSYFLNLEKQHQSTNCIHTLRGSDGNKVTTDSEILEEAKKFYTKLFLNSQACLFTIQLIL